MGAGGQSQTSSSSSAPWSAQQPYLQYGFSEAQRQYENGPAAYYPGQTYTNMSDPTVAGLGMQTAIAANGNPVVNNAAGMAADTTAGRYLDPASNPWLSQTYQAASGQLSKDFNENTLPGLAGMFGGDAGNSSLALAAGSAAGDLTRAQQNLATSIYGGNYSQERQNQLTAAGMSPQLREAQYGDASKLQQAGAAYENQAGKVLQDDINRWNYAQNAPQAALQDYMSMISGNLGSTTTSRTSGSSTGSALNTGLGAAATIASGAGKGK